SKNICAGYGKKEILHNISISFEKGKLTSVIGPNGCGKSTLLKTALAIISPTCGEISVNKANISSMKRNEVAKHISYLSQGKNIPDMTVEQMVLNGRFPHLSYPRRYTKKDREIAYSAMEKLGLAYLAEQQISSLSGGMRQNAYIAMALAQDTEYILLDEPTTYLDIAHQLSLMKILRGLADEGKGIVAVMHDLPMTLNFSDNIVAINDGALIFSGTPDEICKTDIIKKIFGVNVCFNNQEYYYLLNH
ncbi:MAG: ABC transporter ATP-binding protein, partial [Eubacteriales bacterium]